MDVVGGFVLADGTKAKVLTGVDDHSRFCVCAHVMPRESSRNVCDGLAKAMRVHGVPEEILTDNGKVFTGRFNHPPVEVLFDRICRENGVTHRLTQPRSPTTTGKIERFHRSLRPEFRTDRVFAIWLLCRPSSTCGSPTTTPTGRTKESGWTSPPTASTVAISLLSPRCARPDSFDPLRPPPW